MASVLHTTTTTETDITGFVKMQKMWSFGTVISPTNQVDHSTDQPTDWHVPII